MITVTKESLSQTNYGGWETGETVRYGEYTEGKLPEYTVTDQDDENYYLEEYEAPKKKGKK